MKNNKSKLCKKICSVAGIALALGSFGLTSLDNIAFAEENANVVSEKQIVKTKQANEKKLSKEAKVKLNKEAKSKTKLSKEEKARLKEEQTQKEAEIETTNLVEEPAEVVVEEKQPIVPQSILVSVAGDCTMGSYLEEGQVFDPEYREPGSYEAYYQAYGPEYFFKNVKEVFSKDDFTWINLEGPLTNNGPTEVKAFPIRCHPEEINTLKAGSVEVCHLANNHIYDCDWVGFRDTVNILRENNFGFNGEGYKHTAEKNGIKITFLGYMSFATNSELFDCVKKDIEEARTAGSNVVMVQFHGGEERVYYPPEDQKEVFRHAIDSGADVVIGAHPHVMQGIEMYNGKPICYSMGNFSFGANWNPRDKDTFIYQAEFTLNADKTVALTKQKVIPCRISSVDYRNDFCPTILKGDEGKRVLNRLKTYSEIFAVPYDFTLDFEALNAELDVAPQNTAQ